jgi:hypothetical protein
MGAALTWLNDLAQWFGRWVPRLLLLHPTHRGVRFGPRGGARAVGPGLVLYWPITHALVEIPVTTQSIQLCAQLLPHDRTEGMIPSVRICAAAIQYRVHDAVSAATKALNLHALVDNRAQAAIARHATASTSPDDWKRHATTDLIDELAPYGVTLERLDFTQAGTGVALKNISDWSYTDSAAGTRPSTE